MKYMILMLSLLFSTAVIQAQQVTNVAGGFNTAGNFIIDWNFGELTLVDEVKANSLLVTPWTCS